MGSLWLLCILCNIGCLPYYFRGSRNRGSAIFIGILWFLACVVASVVMGIIGTIVGQLIAGQR